MRKDCLLLLITTLALLAAPKKTEAQRQLKTRFQGWVLSAWGGGAAFTDLQRAQLEGTSRDGSRVQRLMADASPSVGLSVAYWATPSWGLRLQSGVALTRYNLLVPQTAPELNADSTQPGLRIWSHDLTLLVRAPVTPGGRVVPYGILGGGVLHYRGNAGPTVGPFHPVRSATRPALVLGVGAIVPLEQGGTGLTFELVDNIARTPIAAPLGGEPADGHVRWANHLRLSIGISVLGL